MALEMPCSFGTEGEKPGTEQNVPAAQELAGCKVGWQRGAGSRGELAHGELEAAPGWFSQFYKALRQQPHKLTPRQRDSAQGDERQGDGAAMASICLVKEARYESICAPGFLIGISSTP